MPDSLEQRLRRMRGAMDAAVNEAMTAPPQGRVTLSRRGRVLTAFASAVIVTVTMAAIATTRDVDHAVTEPRTEVPRSSDATSVSPAARVASLSAPGYDRIQIEDYLVGSGELTRYRSVTYKRSDEVNMGPVAVRVTTTADPGWVGGGSVVTDSSSTPSECLSAGIGPDQAGRSRFVYRDRSDEYVRADTMLEFGEVLSIELWYEDGATARSHDPRVDLYDEVEIVPETVWRASALDVDVKVVDSFDSLATWNENYDLVSSREGADRLVRESCVVPSPAPRN